MIPEGWKNNYFGWMENIQDWCISRQIWWGHQIPAWYCNGTDVNSCKSECKNPIVAISAPERCPHCEGPLTWAAVSGAGTLFSWATVRRAFLPAFADRVPFVTALVAIAEGPAVRLPTYLVDADPDSLRADEPVKVTFRPLAFSTVPGKSVIVPMFERR